MTLPDDRDPPAAPHFIADDLALDFINSAFGIDEAQMDFLQDDAQVLSWLDQAGLAGDSVTPPVAKRGALVKAAVGLRETAMTLLASRKAGRAGNPDALNRLLARGTSYEQLVWTKARSPERTSHRHVSAVEDLLVPVAEAIAALLADADMDLVRQCGNPECTLWFHDRTKSHQRRWCSMAVCGNRMKVAAFRERRKNA
jgi:predicted RNA-binding Zn ribbon-like protein